MKQSVVTRIPDWERGLISYIADTFLGEFTWGERDCCTWACGAVDAMCGSNLRSRFAGAYTDYASAMRFLGTQFGVVPLIDVAKTVLGTSDAAISASGKVCRGDIVWMSEDLRIVESMGGVGMLGVFDGSCVRAPARYRLACVPLGVAFATGSLAVRVGQ